MMRALASRQYEDTLRHKQRLPSILIVKQNIISGLGNVYPSPNLLAGLCLLTATFAFSLATI